MSDAISGLAGALIGGIAAIGGAALQARSATRRQSAEADEREKQRRAERIQRLEDQRQLIARRYLYQLGDAVRSLEHRVENWAQRGGPNYAEGKFPGYWEITSLYVFARALGAERLLSLEGIYVDLEALSDDESTELPPRAVEEAVRHLFGHDVFYYHRLVLAEATLERSADALRLLTYSEFLRRYQDPAWDLDSALGPVRDAFQSLSKERLDTLRQSLVGLGRSIDAAAKLGNAIDAHVAPPDQRPLSQSGAQLS